MPIIETGSPLISGLASADISGLHRQQQDDQAFALKIQQAQLELERERRKAAQEEEARKAREQVIPQVIQSMFGGGATGAAEPSLQDIAAQPLDSSRTSVPRTAGSRVQEDQLHNQHVSIASQVGPLLGKLDNATMANVLTMMQGQFTRDRDVQARKSATDFIERLGGSFAQKSADGATGKVPPGVQQAIDGFKQMLQDPKTDPSDVVRQAMALAAPKLAQEQDDQRSLLLATKAQATFEQTGKIPSEYAHNQIIALQHGIGDTKFFDANFDKIIGGMEPVGSLWVLAEDAPVARKAMAQALSDKNALAEANAKLAEMRALYEQARPTLEANKNAAASEDRRAALKFRSDAQDANLNLRAKGQEEATTSRRENLVLGKRNAEATLNAKVLELAQKDQDWIDADPGPERDAIEAKIRAKLEPKAQVQPQSNPDEVALIGKMKAQGKSTAEIRDAVLKLRGGK